MSDLFRNYMTAGQKIAVLAIALIGVAGLAFEALIIFGAFDK